ncbi:MAG: hypothetical protein HRT38_14745 [Alteromonadaceae bacterium]|nr:hypothetical protein [Alteromonadaceae bacterium]
MRLNLSWVFMHILLILIVITNLLTGLRIAAVHRPEVMLWSAFLPQGSVHSLHFSVGVSLLTLLLSYSYYRLCIHRILQPTKRAKTQSRYHKFIILLGYTCLGLLLLSGSFLYLGILPSDILLNSHYVAALVLLIYIPLHAGSYFVQYGIKLFSIIFIASNQARKAHIIFILSSIILGIALFFILAKKAPQTLLVHRIDVSEYIKIDGQANEKIWASIKPQVVHTFGGANFNNGSTDVRVKVVQNEIEAFFHISWDDSSYSLNHLPLQKTETGWQVLENGFYQFDEKTYYEDKFAVIISNNCDFAAAGTAHLGPKPLADKPPNWHGKGYHYIPEKNIPEQSTGEPNSKGQNIVDLWQWKAVRTNNMILMDDNFIGEPTKVRVGRRRYTAGYQTDAKQSGAYVMNWQWYKPHGIVPKRIPRYSSLLQNTSNELDDHKLLPVLPWDDTKPYSAEQDTYAIGVMLPSVLYRSNRFEGDRADVRAFARWQDGQWSLELSRKLVTGSSYDISLEENVCLWFAAFDHSQTAHTRHVRPLQLKFRH